jgi:peptidoglycan/LPS O-acetylase OafA/YrhL
MSALQRKSELDGLRSLAVIPVVVAHAWSEILPGGYRGVDIFFVLSGYLIANLIVKETCSGTFTFSEFYRRRALRLMPAFFVVLIATILISWLIQTPSETEITLKTALFASFSASNYFLSGTGGYFSAEAETNPLLHTWSLAVEEQFYIFFPLVLFIILTRAPRAMLPILGMVVLASLFHSYGLYISNSSWAHYSTFGRVWELLVGALLATALAKPAEALKVRLSEVTLSAVAWLSLAAILLSYTWPADEKELAAQAAICLATIALIWSAVDGDGLLSRILRLRVLVWIGLLSYSIYLWHQPVMATTRLFIEDGTFPFLLFTIASSIVLAWLTYRFVERPARIIRWQLRRVLIAVTIASSAVALIFLAGAKSNWFAWRYDDALVSRVIQHPDTWKARSCSNWGVKNPGDISFCRLPATRKTMKKASTVAVWGDSHAMALSAGLVSRERSYDLALYGMAGCAIELEKRESNHDSSMCFQKHKKALADILSDSTTKIVVITSKWGFPANRPEHGDILRSNLDRAISIVKNSGREVILVSAVPVFHQNIPDAILRKQRLRLTVLPYVTIENYRSDKNRMIQGAIDAAQNYEFPVIHSEDTLCPDGICLSVLGNMPLYYDRSHLSIIGANLISEILQKQIEDILDGE